MLRKLGLSTEILDSIMRHPMRKLSNAQFLILIILVLKLGIEWRLRCPGIIKVFTGRSSFSIAVKEDPTPISSCWIENRLGLEEDKVTQDGNNIYDNKAQDNNYKCEKVISSGFNIGVAATTNLTTNQIQADNRNVLFRDALANGCGTVNADKNTFNEGIFEKQQSVGRELNVAKLKEEGMRLGRHVQVHQAYNGRLILEKKRVPYEDRSWDSDDSGSSSFEDSEEG
ncbi:hypothetical protein QYF36_027033 [Acer negundo]|nr:hypothetical protein QYF36_027033 [Acer negundo]